MREATQAVRIHRALEALARDLEALESAGQGVPAVEKNAHRMKGTLNTLRIQFDDLAAVAAGEKGTEGRNQRRIA